MKTRIVSAAVFGLASCAYVMTPAGALAAGPKTVPVTTEQSGTTSIVSGTVVPFKEVTLAAQVAGQVNFIAGREGDPVLSGKLLVSINDDAIQARRRSALAQMYAAEAQLRNAHVQYSRELWSPNSGKPSGMGMPSMMDQFMRPFSGQYAGPNNPWVRRYADLYGQANTLDSARSRLMQARALIEQLDALIRDASLKSPFNGVITEKFVERGDTVQPGQKLMRVAHVAYLRIKAEVPVNLISALRAGEFVPATIDVGRGISVQAKVSQIFPVADASRHTVTVKFDLPMDKLEAQDGAKAAPGAYAEVHIPNPNTQAQKTLSVPSETIIYRGSLPAVEIMRSGNKLMRLVRLGRPLANGQVSILSGLRGDEQVVLQRPSTGGTQQAGAASGQAQ